MLAGWWNAEPGPEAMTSLRELFARKLEETRETIRAARSSWSTNWRKAWRYLETCASARRRGPVHALRELHSRTTAWTRAGAGRRHPYGSPECARRAARPALVRARGARKTGHEVRGAARPSAHRLTKGARTG